MPHWGIALALGPNINNPNPSAKRRQQADEAMQTALSLASSASRTERDFIDALARRHPLTGADLGTSASAYAAAMRAVAERLPDNPYAATLCAEALMILQGNSRWTSTGEPEQGTEELVAFLEGALERMPDHMGLHHYYIHLVEFSNGPERAMASAEFLESAAPGVGHLVHMPAHVYMRTGDYAGAVDANLRAVEADLAYLEAGALPFGYEGEVQQHTLEHLVHAAQMSGQFDVAMRFSEGIDRAQFSWAITDTLMRFHRWEQLLSMEAPTRGGPSYMLVWQFSRVVALAATGRVTEVDDALSMYESLEANVPDGATWVFNPLPRLFPLMRGGHERPARPCSWRSPGCHCTLASRYRCLR